MKKFVIINLLITFILFGCSKEAISECECETEVTRMISFDQGQTWIVNQVDARTGEIMPCSIDGEETNQVYSNAYWYKTVWNCK